MEYWEVRQQEMYESGEMLVNKYFSKLEKAFLQTQRELQRTINDFYTRYATENGLSYADAQKQLNKAELGELKDFINLSMQNIGKHNQTVNNMSIKARITRYQALEAQVDAVLRQLYAIDYQAYAEQTMQEMFKESYYRTWYNIDRYHGFHSNFAQIDPRKIQTLLEYPFNGADFSSRLWKQKDHLQVQLMEAMTTIMVQGRPPQAVVNDFAKSMKSKKFDAYRLLHTESSYLINQATHAAYREDGVEKYQILATLDNKTCGICGDLDKKIYNVDQAVTGKNMPPFHCFCRCTDVPYYDDINISDETRAARDPVTGKIYEVPANMTYDEWKEKFLSNNLAEKTVKKYNNANMKLSFPDETLNIRGMTPDIKKQLDSAIDKLMEEYDIRIKSLSVEAAGKGDLFITGWYEGGMGIVINKNANFDIILSLAVPRYKAGVYAGKNLEDYIAHEIFHVMAYQDCITEQQYLARYMQIEGLYENIKGISKYADRSGSGNEALAEAFVRIRNGEEVAPIVKILVESYVGRWRK